MKIIAVDPSLTRTGFAVITHRDRRDPLFHSLGRITADVDGSPERRAFDIAYQLCDVIAEEDPQIAVVETPAPAVRAHRQARAYQSRYGMCVGVVLAVIAERASLDVFGVAADKWTRGMSKQERAAWLGRLCPGYDRKRDTGMDAADAAELGLWFLGCTDWMRDELRVGS